MRRNIHYKPSKAASIFGGIVGCAMGIFGLFAIPDMGALIGFKAIWCLMAFGMGIYYFLMAAGVVKYNGGYEITPDFIEAKSLTTVAYIILSEVVAEGKEKGII